MLKLVDIEARKKAWKAIDKESKVIVIDSQCIDLTNETSLKVFDPLSKHDCISIENGKDLESLDISIHHFKKVMTCLKHSHLKSITLTASKLKVIDIVDLSKVDNLEYLSMHEIRTKHLKLSSMNNIRYISLRSKTLVEAPELMDIETLQLWRVSKETDLSVLSIFKSINTLDLTECQLENVKYHEAFSKINNLKLTDCPNLISLDMPEDKLAKIKIEHKWCPKYEP